MRKSLTIRRVIGVVGTATLLFAGGLAYADITPPPPSLTAWKLASEVNGCESRPLQVDEHAPPLLLTNQIFPATAILAVACAVLPPEVVAV